MGAKTEIAWTDSTWSPLRARVRDDAAEIAKAKGYTSLVQVATRMAGHVGPHCEHVSDGCKNCYSGTNNGRCLPANGTGLPFDRRSRDLVDPIVDEKALMLPLRWKTPKRIFVENQSDLFGEWVPDEQIDRAFAVMVLARWHTFQVLTKRAERAQHYLNNLTFERVRTWMNRSSDGGEHRPGAYNLTSLARPIRHKRFIEGDRHALSALTGPPFPNIWIGVSAEDQKTADERIPLLLQTPAAVRFVSYEPALGPLTLYDTSEGVLEGCAVVKSGGVTPSTPDSAPEGYDDSYIGIDWVICGGESGPGARPFDIQWARSVVKQCAETQTACFVKQLGSVPMLNEHEWRNDPDTRLLSAKNRRKMPSGFVPVALSNSKGADPNEWPEDLRVQQFPRIREVVCA